MRPGRGRRNRLVIMAREPVAGAVKTRLAGDIGAVAAAWWYRHTLRRLQRRLAGDGRWQTVLAVCPDTALGRRHWCAGVEVVAQGRGDLGDRLQRLLAGMPPGPVLVVGSDIPDLGAAEVARAFRALAAAEFVLGPSGDGGFWAIGQRASRPLPVGIFAGIRWSTPQAGADTERALAPRGRVAATDLLHDVDRGADLAAHAGGHPGPERGYTFRPVAAGGKHG